MKKIKPVASWAFAPYLKKKSNLWSRTEHMLVAAVRSIELVAEHYGTPTVYTDSLGKDILSLLTDKAILLDVYDNIYDNLTDEVWVYPKLLTYQVQAEPYFHFDLDFLCLRKFEDELFDNDILVQSSEDVLEPGTSQYYNSAIIKPYYKLPELFDNPNIDTIKAYNMGFFYIKDMALNKEYTDLALGIIEDNRHVLNEGQNMIQECTIEQQTFGLLMNARNVKVETLVEYERLERWNKDFVHFFGWLKDEVNTDSKMYQEMHLDPYITKQVLEIARYIDNHMVPGSK